MNTSAVEIQRRICDATGSGQLNDAVEVINSFCLRMKIVFSVTLIFLVMFTNDFPS